MSEDLVANPEDCAKEPIHIPGSIQPHGLLFVLREPDLLIVQVSQNVDLLLGIPSGRLLGEHLSVFLNPEQVESVRFALESVEPRDSNPVELGLADAGRGLHLDGFVHRHDGLSFLELEYGALNENVRFLDFYKLVSQLTAKLHTAPSLAGLLSAAALGIRTITGFDRVMIYRFAESQEGEVIAEAKAGDIESFLGLWYPASDIPEQARRLYLLNPIRNIVDVDYTPVPIVPLLNPENGRPIDMSFAGLRSVSPIHCEYLKNMGVTASMSVSIVVEGKLWGLVACHHRAPRFVAFEQRKACAFIGQVLSSEIARREMIDESRFQSNSTATQAKFLELMIASPDPLLNLVRYSPTLLDLIPAAGAAIVEGVQVTLLGETPAHEDIMQIVNLLEGAGVSGTFITRSLKDHFPVTDHLREVASGLIALQLARSPVTYVLFFRPEVAHTVLWGGNPEKSVVHSDDGVRLGPRKSFAMWKESVSGESSPWSKHEVRAAVELRSLITAAAYSIGANPAATLRNQ